MPTNKITTTTRYGQDEGRIPVQPGNTPIDPTPNPVPDPVPDPIAAFTFSALSGDYLAFSHPSRRLALLSAANVWVIRDTSTGDDVTVGDRDGTSVMADFMWARDSDQYWWLNGTAIERRNLDGGVLQSIELTSQADSVNVQWRAGSASGEDRQFVVGYSGTAHWIQWFSEDGLGDGFWIATATGDEELYHNAHHIESGLAFQPQGDRQSLSFLCDLDGGNFQQIETEHTGNDWSHETWEGDKVAFWSNVNSQIEVWDYSDRSSPVLTHAINVREIAAAYGAPDDYVQYQHGHLCSNRLCFSVYNTVTDQFGIQVFDLATSELLSVASRFESDTSFVPSPRPSISRDGQQVVYNSDVGIQVKSVPDFSDPAQEPIFAWDKGDFDDAAFEAWRNAIPLNTTTSTPKPDTNSLVFPATTLGTYFSPWLNHEVPDLESDGSIVASIDEGSFNQHNDFRIEAPARFINRWYIHQGPLYRIDLRFSLRDSVNWSLAGGLNWMIPFQLWGPFSKSWTEGNHPINPPFALRVERASHASLIILAQLYGTENPLAIDWEYDSVSATREIAIGQDIDASIWWQKDETGARSYCRVDINGTKLHEVQNVKLGTPFYHDGSVADSDRRCGGIMSLGCYTFDDFSHPGVECIFKRVRVYQF